MRSAEIEAQRGKARTRSSDEIPYDDDDDDDGQGAGGLLRRAFEIGRQRLAQHGLAIHWPDRALGTSRVRLETQVPFG